MAGNTIKGITIEIEGNTTKLQTALSKLDGSLKTTQAALRDVNKGLKFDPGNADLLRLRQEYLADAVTQTREKLDLLTRAMKENGDSLPADEYRKLETDIATTQASLNDYERQAEEAAQASEALGDGTSEAGDQAASAGQQFEGAGADAAGAGQDIAGAGDDAETTAGQMEDAGDAAETAGDQAEESSGGWSIVGQVIADLAKDAISKAIDGLKKLGSIVTDSIKGAASYGDEVLTLATQTGLATDTIQELMYSAELMDVDFGTVQKSLFKLTQNMNKTEEGNEGLAAAFDRLGVSIDAPKGGMRTAEQVFYDVIDALGTVENQTDRDALAFEIFGKSSQELNSMIAIGSDGIKEFADEAHAAGAVMDGDALEALGAMDDGFQRANQSIEAAKRELALALAPAISTVAETFAEMARDADWQEIFSGIAEGVAEILPSLLSMAKKALPAISEILGTILPIVLTLLDNVDFGPLLDAVIDCLNVLAPVLAQLAVDLLPSLVDLIAAVIPIITDIIEVLKPILEIIGPGIAAVLQLISTGLTTFQQIISNYVLPILGKLSDKAKEVGDKMREWVNRQTEERQWMVNNWSIIEETVSRAVQNMKTVLANSWQAIVSTTTSKFQEVKNKIVTPIEQAVSAVKNLISNMKSAFSGVSFSLPRIRMPHLSVSGSWSFNPPRVPSFSVRWYRDAMRDGMILNTPTIFGQMNGRLLGAGEAGPEAVVGVTSLREMIRDAVTGSTTNNNYGGVNVVVYGAPGQDVNELADIIEDRINANIARRAAAF